LIELHADLFGRSGSALGRPSEGGERRAASRWWEWACCIRGSFLQQTLDPDGWQQERAPVNDFHSLPITPLTGQPWLDWMAAT